MLRFMVIVMGSIIIYWRCITAVVFYPKGLGWKLSSLAQFFQIENFWKRHLLGIIESFNTNEESGDRTIGKLMMVVCRITRFHKLLYVLHYLFISSILLSKICWLLAHLLFSNKYLAKLLMGSAYDEFSNLSRSENHREILLGKASEYDKYL
ncbi:hypothetical protein SUGI_0889480 [Cryptomeria japonica]|nr:hypothetical protein SUGI_0889480 [Cryptomeria japonica]